MKNMNEMINGRKSYFDMTTAEKAAYTRSVQTYTDPVKMRRIIEEIPLYQYNVAFRIGVDPMVISLLKSEPMKSLPREVLLRMYNLYTGMKYSWMDFCDANGTIEWSTDFPVERDQEAWRIETSISQHLFRKGKAVARSFLSKFNGKDVPYDARTPDVSYTIEGNEGEPKRINVRIVPLNLKSVPTSHRNELIMEAYNEVQALLLVDAKEEKLLAGEPYIFAYSDKTIYKMVVDQFSEVSTNNYISFAFVDTMNGVVYQETPLKQNGNDVCGVLTHLKRKW